MTIKASSLLAIIAVWGFAVPAVVVEPAGWWSLIFAGLSTAMIGTSAGRSLGLSRLIAITGIWGGTALAVSEGEAWVSVFAFLATGAVVFSVMRRTALLNGLGIAVAWLATGAVVSGGDGDGAWISVFAFLTAASVANHRSESRGIAAAAWWAFAGIVMVTAGGWYWLAAIAWLLSTASLGFTGFTLPSRIEWDLFDRD